jgi:hypothetical protein
MVGMNPIIEDRLMKMHIAKIQADLTKISLGEQAAAHQHQQPNWFALRLQKIGQWLIQMGEKLDNTDKLRESRYKSNVCNYAQ